MPQIQTIETLLNKIHALHLAAQKVGLKAEVLGLTAEDEETIRTHAWMRDTSKGAPDPRKVYATGFAGFAVSWDAKLTTLAPHGSKTLSQAQAKPKKAAKPTPAAPKAPAAQAAPKVTPAPAAPTKAKAAPKVTPAPAVPAKAPTAPPPAKKKAI